MKVRYSYLPEQFRNPDEILARIKAHLATCQFTLGAEVDEFERSFASLIGTRYAVGVGSGTDALKLALRAAGVGPGDEVITAANTFIATAGAIRELGARPVFVDVTRYYTLDPNRIEAAITPRTRAILPVHLTGEPADMDEILDVARRRSLVVIEDACQAILASIRGKRVGTFGLAAGYSLHPLKNLNVWGDAGVVVTDSAEIDERLRMLRNHGMKNRDEIEIFGFNSRLDSIQAIVGNWLLPQVHEITAKRIANAKLYDNALSRWGDRISLAPRRSHVQQVFHLYMFEAEEKERDVLYRHLIENGVEAKIHYPIPLFLQKGLRELGYRPGDFPETERQAKRVISLPVDQHLTQAQLGFVTEVLERYFAGAPNHRGRRNTTRIDADSNAH